MAQPFPTTNLTSGYRNTIVEQYSPFCPPVTKYSYATDHAAPSIANATFNVSTAIVTTLANLLVLLAMRHVTSLRLPSKLLFCSLVFTDLGSGFVVQPQLIVLVLLSVSNSTAATRLVLGKSVYVTAALFSCASLFSMIGISIDRHTALYSHLKYPQIITSRRVFAYLAFLWIFSLIFASSYLWSKVFYYVITIGGILSTFVIISVAYIRIFRRLRVVQVQSHDQAPQQVTNTLNISSYRKTASAMLWVYVIFIICYLPHVVMYIVVAIVGCTPRLQFIRNLCYTPVLLNSCINPLVYCFRIREIRSKVLGQIRQVLC